MFKRFWKIVFPESFVNLNVRCTMNILDHSVVFIIIAIPLRWHEILNAIKTMRIPV